MRALVVESTLGLTAVGILEALLAAGVAHPPSLALAEQRGLGRAEVGGVSSSRGPEGSGATVSIAGDPAHGIVGLASLHDALEQAALSAHTLSRGRHVLSAMEGALARATGTEAAELQLSGAELVDFAVGALGVLSALEELGAETVQVTPIVIPDGGPGGRSAFSPEIATLIGGLPLRFGRGTGEISLTAVALLHALNARAAEQPFRLIRLGTSPHDQPVRTWLVDLAAPTSLPDKEILVQLAADLDDMSGEYITAAAELLRTAGALDVLLLPSVMKKGRPGIRIEVLARTEDADRLESVLVRESTTIGVRRWAVQRSALTREIEELVVSGQRIRVKVVRLPDGSRRAKPEFEDVSRAAARLGIPVIEVYWRAVSQYHADRAAEAKS